MPCGFPSVEGSNRTIQTSEAQEADVLQVVPLPKTTEPSSDVCAPWGRGKQCGFQQSSLGH